MNIDIHSHFIPDYFLKSLSKKGSSFKTEIITKDGQPFISHKDLDIIYPCHRGFYDIGVKLQDMEQRNIHTTVLSVAPPLFYYWSEPEISLYVAQLVNDEAYTLVKQYPDKIQAMATVPLNDVQLAVKELERAVNELGLKGVEIGAQINGRLISDPNFYPFFKRAEELDVLIFVHPLYVDRHSHLQNYYLSNFIGNPYETTVAIANVIFSGLMESFPKLKLCFAHGGGFFPYQIGRFEHGYHVRPEASKDIYQSPLDTLKQLYFDTITFHTKPLAFLAQLVGSDQILMGSDAPFQMSDPDPVTTVSKLDISSNEKKNILGRNAIRLLGI